MSAPGVQLNWPFAALWTGGLLAAWLISCSIQPWGSRWAMPLMTLACELQAVMLWLRWPGYKNLPIPRDWTAACWPEVTRSIDAELTRLLAWTSQLYALAAVAQLTDKLWPAVLALVPVVASELWLWRLAPKAGHAQANEQLASEQLASEHSASEHLADRTLDMPGELATSLDTMRSQNQGQLAGGECYQSGWVKVTLLDQQRSLAQTVVFSPPFLVAPVVDLDYELLDDALDEEPDVAFELSAEHLTPSGMRISLKRSSPSGQARAKLLWHASQSEAEPLRPLP